MSKLVRKTLADSPMTPARKRKLAQLAGRPDSEIDFLGDSTAQRQLLEERRPRQQGKGYQTRLNRVLREVMLEDIKKSA